MIVYHVLLFPDSYQFLPNNFLFSSKTETFVYPQKEVKSLQTLSPHTLYYYTKHFFGLSLVVKQQSLFNIYLTRKSLDMHYLFYRRDRKVVALRILYRVI